MDRIRSLYAGNGGMLKQADERARIINDEVKAGNGATSASTSEPLIYGAGAVGGGLLGYLLSKVLHKKPGSRTRLLYALLGATAGGVGAHALLNSKAFVPKEYENNLRSWLRNKDMKLQVTPTGELVTPNTPDEKNPSLLAAIARNPNNGAKERKKAAETLKSLGYPVDPEKLDAQETQDYLSGENFKPGKWTARGAVAGAAVTAAQLAHAHYTQPKSQDLINAEKARNDYVAEQAGQAKPDYSRGQRILQKVTFGKYKGTPKLVGMKEAERAARAGKYGDQVKEELHKLDLAVEKTRREMPSTLAKTLGKVRVWSPLLIGPAAGYTADVVSNMADTYTANLNAAKAQANLDYLSQLAAKRL